MANSAAEKRLIRLIEDTPDLPTIPRVTMEVAHLVDSPTTSASTVAHALARDQALTAKVLKMANSAFYGAPRKISTVTDAIVLLGMHTIRNMTMAVSCQEVLDREVISYAIRRGDLWKHSMCVGFAAQQIAKKARYRITEEAFVAGLLHDIGKVLISTYLSKEFSDVMLRAQESNQEFSVSEQDILGFDHAEVGARLTEHWNLPSHLVEAIRYHHTPSLQEPPNALTSIVHLADVLCITLGIGLGTDGLRYSLEDETVERLHLDDAAVDSLLMAISEFAIEQGTAL
jgi:putative nucleotidyltransferase with HDIG domain